MQLKKIIEIAPFIIFAFLFATLSTRGFFADNFVDEWVYLYIGKHWDLGHALYVDLPDNKGPSTYLLYKSLYAAFGENFLAWKLAYLSFAILGGFAIWQIGRKKFSSGAANMMAGAYFCMLLNPAGQMFSSPEIMAFSLLATSLAFLTHGRGELVAGAMLGICVLTNIVMVPSLAAVAMLSVAGEIKPGWKYIAGLLVVLALSAAYLTSAGALGDFIEHFFIFNFVHKKFGDSLLGSFAIFSQAKEAAMPLLAIAAALLSRRRETQIWGVGFAVVATAPLLMLVRGNDMTHYISLICPIYGIAAGSVFMSLEDKWPSKAVAYTTFVVLLAAAATYQLTIFAAHQSQNENTYSAEKEYALARYPELAGSKAMLIPMLEDGKYYQIFDSKYPGKYFFLMHEYSNSEIIMQKEEGDYQRNIGNVDAVVMTRKSSEAPDWKSYAERLPGNLSLALVNEFSCSSSPILGVPRQLTVCLRKK